MDMMQWVLEYMVAKDKLLNTPNSKDNTTGSILHCCGSIHPIHNSPPTRYIFANSDYNVADEIMSFLVIKSLICVNGETL
jgi:hypothetical protein